MTTLAIGLFTGSLGAGYFLYGKKQQKLVAILAGILLCAAPYLVANLIALLVISAALAALPFFIDV